MTSFAKRQSTPSTDDQMAKRGIGAPLTKEQESPPEAAEVEEEKLMAEIRTTAETADRQALEVIQTTIAEAKRAHFEPELPPDVEDAGVVSPVKKAEEVVQHGTTIELGTTEQAYKQGLHAKIAGHVTNKVVAGVSSLAALALWISRLLKMAHKHTMRIIFRKEVKHAD